MLLDATSDTRVRDMFTIPGITESSGDIGDIKRWFINLPLHCLRKKGHCENNTFLRYEDRSCQTKLNHRLADGYG